MKQRVTRFGAVVFLALAMVGSTAQPAQAIVVQSVVFAGVLTVSNGLSYPCVTGKNPSPPNPPQFDQAKCPPATPNTMTWTFTGQALSNTAKVAKAKCLLTDLACAAVQLSQIRGIGTITGNCSTWTGNGSVTWSSIDIVNTKEPGSSGAMSVSFVNLGGLNVMTGTASRPGATGGSVFGSFMAVVESPTNSCWDKRQKTWVLAGGYTIIWPNN